MPCEDLTRVITGEIVKETTFEEVLPKNFLKLTRDIQS